MTRVQIGWLTEAIEDEDDLASLINNARPWGISVDALSDYTAESEIHHSHGPVLKPIPVYVDWP